MAFPYSVSSPFSNGYLSRIWTLAQELERQSQPRLAALYLTSVLLHPEVCAWEEVRQPTRFSASFSSLRTPSSPRRKDPRDLSHYAFPPYRRQEELQTRLKAATLLLDATDMISAGLEEMAAEMVAPTIQDCLSLTRALLSPLFVRSSSRVQVNGIAEMIMESHPVREHDGRVTPRDDSSDESHSEKLESSFSFCPSSPRFDRHPSSLDASNTKKNSDLFATRAWKHENGKSTSLLEPEERDDEANRTSRAREDTRRSAVRDPFPSSSSCAPTRKETFFYENAEDRNEAEDEKKSRHSLKRNEEKEKLQMKATMTAPGEEERQAWGAVWHDERHHSSSPSRSLFFSSMVDHSVASRVSGDTAQWGVVGSGMSVCAALEGALDPFDQVENDYFFYPPHMSALAWRETSFALTIPNELLSQLPENHSAVEKQVGTGERSATPAAVVVAQGEATDDACVDGFRTVKEAKQEQVVGGEAVDSCARRTPLFCWFHHVACGATTSHQRRSFEGEKRAPTHGRCPSSSSPPPFFRTTPFALLLRAFLLLSRWYRQCGNLAAALDVLQRGKTRLDACLPMTGHFGRLATSTAGGRELAWKEEKTRLLQELKDRFGGIHTLERDGTSAPSIGYAVPEFDGATTATEGLLSSFSFVSFCDQELERVLDAFWTQEVYYAHLLWHTEYCSVLYAMFRFLSSPSASWHASLPTPTHATAHTESDRSQSRKIVAHIKRERDRHVCLSQLLTYAAICFPVDAQFQQWGTRWRFASSTAPEVEDPVNGKGTHRTHGTEDAPYRKSGPFLHHTPPYECHAVKAVPLWRTTGTIGRSTVCGPFLTASVNVSPCHRAVVHPTKDSDDSPPPPSVFDGTAQRRASASAPLGPPGAGKEMLRGAPQEGERCACVSTSFSPLLLLLPLDATEESDVPCRRCEASAKEEEEEEMDRTTSWTRPSPVSTTVSSSSPSSPSSFSPQVTRTSPPPPPPPPPPAFTVSSLLDPLRRQLQPSCLIAWISCFSSSSSTTLRGEESVDVLPSLRLVAFLYAYAFLLSFGTARQDRSHPARTRKERKRSRAYEEAPPRKVFAKVGATITQCSAIGGRAADGFRRGAMSPVIPGSGPTNAGRERLPDTPWCSASTAGRRRKAEKEEEEEVVVVDTPPSLPRYHWWHTEGGREVQDGEAHRTHSAVVHTSCETEETMWDEFSVLWHFFSLSSLSREGEKNVTAVAAGVGLDGTRKEDAQYDPKCSAAFHGTSVACTSSVAEDNDRAWERMEETTASTELAATMASLMPTAQKRDIPKDSSSSSFSSLSSPPGGMSRPSWSSPGIPPVPWHSTMHWTTVSWRQLMQQYHCFCTLAALPPPPPLFATSLTLASSSQPSSGVVSTNTDTPCAGVTVSSLLSRYTAFVHEVDREIQRVCGKDGGLSSMLPYSSAAYSASVYSSLRDGNEGSTEMQRRFPGRGADHDREKNGGDGGGASAFLSPSVHDHHTDAAAPPAAVATSLSRSALSSSRPHLDPCRHPRAALPTWEWPCTSSPPPSPGPTVGIRRRTINEKERRGDRPFLLPTASSVSFLLSLKTAAHLTMASTALRQRYPLECVRCLASWQQCVTVFPSRWTPLRVWGHVLVALLALQMGVADVPASPNGISGSSAVCLPPFSAVERHGKEGDGMDDVQRTSFPACKDGHAAPPRRVGEPTVVGCFQQKAWQRYDNAEKKRNPYGKTHQTQGQPSSMRSNGESGDANASAACLSSLSPWKASRMETSKDDLTMPYHQEVVGEEWDEEEVDENEIAAWVGLPYYHLLVAESMAAGEERDILTCEASCRERDPKGGSESWWRHGYGRDEAEATSWSSSDFDACGPSLPPSLLTSSPSFVLQLQLLKLFAIYVAASSSRSRMTLVSSARHPAAHEEANQTREGEAAPCRASLPHQSTFSSLAPSGAPPPSTLLRCGRLEVQAHAAVHTQKHCQRICRIKLHHLLHQLSETCRKEEQEEEEVKREHHEAEEERKDRCFSPKNARGSTIASTRRAATASHAHGRIPAEAWTTYNRSLLLLIHGLFAVTEEDDPYLGKKQWQRALRILEPQRCMESTPMSPSQKTHCHTATATAAAPPVCATHTQRSRAACDTRTPWVGEIKVLLSLVSQEVDEEIEEGLKTEMRMHTEDEIFHHSRGGLSSMEKKGGEDNGSSHCRKRTKSSSINKASEYHSGIDSTLTATTTTTTVKSGCREAHSTEEKIVGDKEDEEAITPITQSRHQKEITKEAYQMIIQTAIDIASGTRMDTALSSTASYPQENAEEIMKERQRLSFSALFTAPTSVSTSRRRGWSESEVEGLESGRRSPHRSEWMGKHDTKRHQQWDALPPSAAVRRWRQVVWHLCTGGIPAPPSSRPTPTPLCTSTALPHTDSASDVPPTTTPFPSCSPPPCDFSTLTADTSFASLGEVDVRMLHEVFGYLPIW